MIRAAGSADAAQVMAGLQALAAAMGDPFRLSAAQLAVGSGEAAMAEVRVFLHDGQLVMQRTEGSWPVGTRIVLHDASGRMVLQRSVSGAEVHAALDHLVDGVYGWQLITPGLVPVSGRTVVQRP